jgi:methionyl-tRNA formyltransferase
MPPTFSIIFAGTPEFATPSLEALVADPSFNVTLVISQPDKPVGRKQILTPPPVTLTAKRHGIPVLQPRDINKELLQEDRVCDFLVTVAYGQILSEEVLQMPRIAPVNVHASLLPKWRGASPMQQALLSKDAETGITIQKMVKALDAGDILSQESVSIAPDETIVSLHDTLAALGADLLVRTLKEPLTPTPQNTDSVTFCSKLSREDGKLDASAMSAENIDLHVRALVPWPGVTCSVLGTTVKLLKTNLREIEDSLALPCAESTTLFIQELQPPGGKPMSAASWARGKQ